MNTYMHSQIANMIIFVKTFEESCRMAATKSDGNVDKAEEKQLKKINKAAQQFINRLEKLK